MKITNNRKPDTLIAGRNYYSLYSSADDHDKAIPSTYADNLFLIYFPDDFRTSLSFYQLLITDYYNLPKGNKKNNESDLKPIFSLMKSFKIE